MQEYTRNTGSASQFEGQELAPDWEWAVARYAADIRKAILAELQEVQSKGLALPSAIAVDKIVQEAAQARLRAVRGW